MSTTYFSRQQTLPRRRLIPAVSALLIAVGILAGIVAGMAANGQAEERAGSTTDDWRSISAQVDAIIEAKLAEEGVRPAARSSDNEFLRRLYLDLLGTVPTPAEVEAFAADSSRTKRAVKIDALLESDAYAEHQASFWFRTLTGLSVHQGRQREGQGGRYVTGEGGKKFHQWLATQVAENRPYDQMAMDLISATGRTDKNGAAGYIARWESNANNTAGAVAKHFLGVQIQCAQCHDHIYEADWKQKDFQGMAAFFATTRVQRVPEYGELRQLRTRMQNGGKLPNNKKGGKKAGKKGRDLKRPGAAGEGMDGGGMNGMDEMGGGSDARPTAKQAMSKQAMAERMRELRKYANIVTVTDQKVNPRASQRLLERMKRAKKKNPDAAARIELLGTTPKFWMAAQAADVPGIPRRYLLARWVTSTDNPYFARTLANRMWGHFMGRGIVHPIDDFNSFQAPSHPEILKILGEDFKANGHDLRRIQRILLGSATYQRTSRWTEEEQPDASLFAKAPIRPLDTEQLYFALIRATGIETKLNQASRRQQQQIQQAIFSVFTFVYDDDEGKAEVDFSGSIPQGLFLMNGELLQRALSGGNGQTDRQRRRGGGKNRNRRRRQPQSQSMLAELLRTESSETARVDQLCVRAFGRKPTTGERGDATSFIKAQGGGAKAYEDFFWAILNSAEFMTNH